MPPSSPQAAAFDINAGGLTIDRAAHSIRMTRDLAAPPERVFAAWTQAEQVARWWDAAGEPLAHCEIDLRVGGGFRFVSRGHPDMPFAGTYREISPPDLIVFDAMGAEGRVTLGAQGADPGRTRMIVEIICGTGEQLDHFLQMGVAAGTSRTLDNLVALIEG